MAWMLGLAVLGLAVFLAGLFLLHFFCGRRAVPDYWDAAEIDRQGYGGMKALLLSDRDFFAGLPLRDVWAESDDGLPLHGVLAGQTHPRGTILLFHSYRSSWKLDFAGLARFLHSLGFQLILTEERAHGQSGGRFITFGVWERFDVRAWANYVSSRYGEAHPIFLYGVSMGGAAVLMASALELPGNVRGLIGDSAYDAPDALLRRTLSARSFLPAGPPLALLNAAAALLAGFSLGDCSAAESLAESAYPVLLIHGTADRTVPIETALRNLRVCASRKKLLRVEGAGHGLCWLTGGPALEKSLREFLETHIG